MQLQSAAGLALSKLVLRPRRFVCFLASDLTNLQRVSASVLASCGIANTARGKLVRNKLSTLFRCTMAPFKCPFFAINFFVAFDVFAIIPEAAERCLLPIHVFWRKTTVGLLR